MAKIKKGVQYAVIRGEGVKYKKTKLTNGVTKATVHNTALDVVDIIENSKTPIGVLDYRAYMLDDHYSAMTSCLPTETFDENKGKDIAKRKCLIRMNTDKIDAIDRALADLEVVKARLERQKKIASERIARDKAYLADEVAGKHTQK